MNQDSIYGKKAGLAGIVLSLLLGIWLLPLIVPSIEGIWGINSTVVMNTTVNITNAQPEIRGNVTLETPIDLEAYGNKTVTCNATIFDWDNDTLRVNGTLYIVGTTYATSPDDGNNHYTVANCTRLTPQDREMNYSCEFIVKYYADNSSNWQCNLTVIDDESAYSNNISNLAEIEPLIAIYAPGSIDYGELAVNDISEAKLANLTNAGNMRINISVEGWGATPGDNLAMSCSYGNIPVQYERYLGYNDTYNNMVDLSSTTAMINSPFYIEKRTDESIESMNATYWRLQIPPLAGGICTGKILFTAIDYTG